MSQDDMKINAAVFSWSQDMEHLTKLTCTWTYNKLTLVLAMTCRGVAGVKPLEMHVPHFLVSAAGF